MTTADELLIEIDRVLAAGPATVWRAITDPELLPRWLGPEGSECRVVEQELTLGGRLELEITLPGDMVVGLYGFYEHVDPPRRLVHSWAMVGEDVLSTVTWDLEPVGEGTRLSLTHVGLADLDEVQQNDAGWRHLLDRLEALLAA